MTKRTLLMWLVIVSIYLLFLVFVAVYAHIKGWSEFISLYKDLLTPLSGLALAWLGYCFQRRHSYTQALRAFWRNLTEAVQDAIQYTYKNPAPDAESFSRTLRNISIAIDDLRCIFQNIHEKKVSDRSSYRRFVFEVKVARSVTDIAKIARPDIRSDHIGLYPFESIKQIHHCISLLGYGDRFTPENAKLARDAITALWAYLRTELLREFDRDLPEFPDTPFHNPS